MLIPIWNNEIGRNNSAIAVGTRQYFLPLSLPKPRTVYTEFIGEPVREAKRKAAAVIPVLIIINYNISFRLISWFLTVQFR